MTEPRHIIWWSTGAASAVTAFLYLREQPDAIIARCETANEDPDNYRFEADVMRRLNRAVTILKSDEFDSVPDVWRKERYMAGIHGASCTRAMKVRPRLAFQLPTDIHIFRDRTRRLRRCVSICFGKKCQPSPCWHINKNCAAKI